MIYFIYFKLSWQTTNINILAFCHNIVGHCKLLHYFPKLYRKVYNTFHNKSNGWCLDHHVCLMLKVMTNHICLELLKWRLNIHSLHAEVPYGQPHNSHSNQNHMYCSNCLVIKQFIPNIQLWLTETMNIICI